MPTVKVNNPFGQGTESETVEFPDFYTTSMMEDEVREKYPNKYWGEETDQETKAHPPGLLTEFSEAFGDSWTQASEDLAIGSAILRSDDSEAFSLLEEEYQNWKKSPDDVKDYEILSGGFVGQAFGGVARDVMAGLSVGVAASTFSTPVGGLYVGASTVATLQGMTAKGGSMRNTYIAVRNEMDRNGDVDFDKAYETARRVSNADAAFAVGEAGLATLVPVARMTPGLGTRALSQAATKGAAELGFDATIGATGSVLSDVYAESEGIDRGDILENSLRSALQEMVVGGIPAGLRTYSEYQNIRQEQTDFVNQRLREGEDVLRLPDPTPKARLTHTPWIEHAETPDEVIYPAIRTRKAGDSFDWTQEDLDNNWEFLEAPENRPENPTVRELQAERIRQATINSPNKKVVIVPVFSEDGQLVGVRKATRAEVDQLKQEGKNPVVHQDNFENIIIDQPGGAGGQVLFSKGGGVFYEMNPDGSLVSLDPVNRSDYMAASGELLPFNEAFVPDVEIDEGNLTWRDVLKYFPEEVLAKPENLEVMTGGLGEIGKILKRELDNNLKRQVALGRPLSSEKTKKPKTKIGTVKGDTFSIDQLDQKPTATEITSGQLSKEAKEKLLDQPIPNDLDAFVKDRITSVDPKAPDIKKRRFFAIEGDGKSKIAVNVSKFGHSVEGVADADKNLASQIGTYERLIELETVLDNRIKRLERETIKKINDSGATIYTKGGQWTTPATAETNIKKWEVQLADAKKEVKTAKVKGKLNAKIERLKKQIAEWETLLNKATKKLGSSEYTPLPKTEDAILFEFLSSPTSPNVGPYVWDQIRKESTTVLNGKEHIKDSGEMDALLKLKSALKGVELEIGSSQIETIDGLLSDGKITSDQAIEIANKNAFIQEGQTQSSIDVEKAIKAETPVTKVTNTTKSYNPELPVIDLKHFNELAEGDLGPFVGTKGYQMSGGLYTKNKDEAIFDKALRKALDDDIRTVQYRVKQLEKYKWLKAQIYVTNKKGIKDAFPKLFNEDGIKTGEDLDNRIKEIEAVLANKRIKKQTLDKLDNYLLEVTERNNRDILNQAANYFDKYNLRPKTPTSALDIKTNFTSLIRDLKTKQEGIELEGNHFNKARRAFREVLTALRGLGKLEGTLYANGFVNFSAIPQLYKALVKLAIAATSMGIGTVKDFANAIRQPADNAAVKEAFEDAKGAKIRTGPAFSERVLQGLLEILKKRQINKAEQKQAVAMDGWVKASWDSFLDRHSLEQYKEKGEILPPVKMLFKRTFLNEYIDLPYIMAKIAKGGEVSSSQEVEDILRKLSDSENAAYLIDALETVVAEKGLNIDKLQDRLKQELLDNKVDVKKFTDYLIAKHASERNDHAAKINPDEFSDVNNKGGSGMGNIEAEKILKEAQRNGTQNIYERLYKEYIKPTNDKTLDIAFESGLIDQENYNRLKSFYQFYVPLRGKEGVDAFMQATGNGVDIRGDEFKRALGRFEKPTDVIPYVFQQHNNMLLRAEKAKVMQALAEFVAKNPNPDIKLAEPDYVRRLKNVKGVPKVKWIRNPHWTNDTDLVGFKIEGKQYYLRFKNKALAHRLRNQGAASSGVVLRQVGKVTKLMSRLNTQYNIGFTLPNFIKDVMFAKINLQAMGHEKLATEIANFWNMPGMPATLAGKKQGAIMKALAATSRAEQPELLGRVFTKLYGDEKTNTEWDAAYEEMKQYGGRIQFRGIYDISDRITELEKLSHKISAINGTKNPSSKKQAIGKLTKGLIGFIEDANSAFESASRLATYKVARENGATPQQAAYLSRNISINFTKRGTAGAGLNNLFMFYNASAQGSYQVINNLKNTKKGKEIAFQIAFTGFTLEWLNQALSGEDENGISYYEQIPEWKKSSNIIIMNPVTGKDALTIPMPYGYNVLHYVGAKTAKVAKGGYLESDQIPGTQNPASAGWDLVEATMAAFNPIGGSTSVARAMTPDVADFVVDLASNTDWKGDKIMPEASPFEAYPKPDSQRYWSTVNPWIKDLTTSLNSITGGNTIESGFVDVSPETVETILSQFTGGAGNTIIRLTDLVRPDTWKDGVPEGNDWPVVRRFVAAPNSFYGLEKYKKVRELSERAVAVHKMYVQERRRDLASEFKSKNEALFKINPRVKATNSKIRSINKSMRQVSASRALSNEEKAIKLSKLKIEKNNAMKTAYSKFIELFEAE